MKGFENMPAISDEVKEWLPKMFTPFLFFETVEREVRKYTCSACGEEFYNGRGVCTRTLTEEDRALWGAPHNSVRACPFCGTAATLKNIHRCNIGKLSEYNHAAVFLQEEDGTVWIRCLNFWKDYLSPKSKMQTREVMRYRLKPGAADMWTISYYDEWTKESIVREAFVWNHGYFCEKYPYRIIEDGMTIRDSFLKYNSYGSYEGAHGFHMPFIKYLCWYARHLQIEMLVKLGLFKTVDEMIFSNTDCRSVLDWDAKTPWDLHRLSKPLYQAWRQRYYADMDVLKVFSKLKGKTEKDLNTACAVRDFCRTKKQAYELIADCKKIKIEPRRVIRYCEKLAGTKKGKWNAAETFEMWMDYIDMAKVSGTIKTVSPFPANLKAAHDSLLAAYNIAKNKMDAAKLKEEAEKAAAPIKKRFPKIEKIYAELAEKYSYSDEQYAIVVPGGVEDIVLDGMVLAHCTTRTDRYYERITARESFILFLRHANEPDIPWYALEVEPGGTIRQKRTKGDEQLDDLNDALPFLLKWQEVVASRMTANDKRQARRSKILRNEGFEELRKTKKRINYGPMQGRLLIEALERDLMEAGA